MYGNYIPVASDKQVIAYVRSYEGYPSFLVVLNLSHRPAYFNPLHMPMTGTVLVGTVPDLEGQRYENRINLSGDEGVLVRLDD